MADYGSTDRVRKQAVERYILPARLRGEATITIHSGEFAKELVRGKLLASDRFPIVCGALSSPKFLRENRLTLLHRQGPPSGKSSTVTFTYRVDELPSETPQPSRFEGLRGILRTVYQELGGAEVFHRSQREGWDR